MCLGLLVVVAIPYSCLSTTSRHIGLFLAFQLGVKTANPNIIDVSFFWKVLIAPTDSEPLYRHNLLHYDFNTLLLKSGNHLTTSLHFPLIKYP